MGHDFTSDERYQTDHSTSPVIAAKDKRIAELEAALKTIADAQHDIGSFAMWARYVAREALTKSET